MEVLIFLTIFSACTYFLVKYVRLVIINANVNGFREVAKTVVTLLREEPLFLILYFGFLICLNILSFALLHILT